ncbi:MAG: hypothetical protein EA339_02335 [Rhodobacteraceae bacterium]|nr:MAG: hypothetical protein EA339_02335 [Paracoccaceae bacterium]
MVAPEAEVFALDYDDTTQRIELSDSRLDIVNLSFGLISPSRNFSVLNGEALAASVLAAARESSAVIVKAAGNAAVGEQPVSVDSRFRSSFDGSPTVVADILNLALIGAESTIFVGALERNGTVENPTVLAEYSFFAGDNVTIQNQFLTVGVDSARMGGLAGTSFAAPIVSGYAAILGSKFEDATPRQIAGQLLNTAREDTIRGFDPALHGRGEASLSRALSPDRIR